MTTIMCSTLYYSGVRKRKKGKKEKGKKGKSSDVGLKKGKSCGVG